MIRMLGWSVSLGAAETSFCAAIGAAINQQARVNSVFLTVFSQAASGRYQSSDLFHSIPQTNHCCHSVSSFGDRRD